MMKARARVAKGGAIPETHDKMLKRFFFVAAALPPQPPHHE